MNFLEAKLIQVGLAVSVLAVVATVAYIYSTKKTKVVGSIDTESFKEFKLVKRTQLNHNVAKFRFALPTPTSVLGHRIGQFIRCRGKDSQGVEVIKPYHPITIDTDYGYFELVVKMYPQGRMSHHFRQMREGDYLEVKGPEGYFKHEPTHVRAYGMLVGGTGITPIFQIVRGLLENLKDTTQLHLIYANETYKDIILKEEIDGLATNYPSRFHVYYVLNQPPEEWTGGVGFISKDMIRTHCPAPASDIKMMMCGPRLMNYAMPYLLIELGYSPGMHIQFN